MSIKCMNYVWEQSETTGADRLMLLALAYSCNDDGEWSPGVARLADKCKVSERAAQYTLRRLEELGELEIHTGQGFATKNGRTNKYVMKRYQEVQSIAGVQSIAPVRVKPIAPQGVKPVAPESSVLPTSITPQVEESALHSTHRTSSKREDLFFDRMCWIVGLDHTTISTERRGQLNQARGILVKAGYTADDLVAFWEQVWKKDWRYTKNKSKPTIQQLRYEIGKVKAKDEFLNSREHDTTIVIDPQVWDTTGLDW